MARDPHAIIAELADIADRLADLRDDAKRAGLSVAAVWCLNAARDQVCNAIALPLPARTRAEG